MKKYAHPEVGDFKCVTLDQRRFDCRDPLQLIDLLSVRKRASKIITVYAIKKSAAVQLDGARGFLLEADDLLPLYLLVLGLRHAAFDAGISAGILSSPLPGERKCQHHYQCHKARNSKHF